MISELSTQTNQMSIATDTHPIARSPQTSPMQQHAPPLPPGGGGTTGRRRKSSATQHSTQNSIETGIPPSSEEWKERGAATLVKSERDENGQVTTKVIKKGVKDFNFGKTLGEGSYSTVMMASDRQTLRDYAIKVLDKRHIIKEKKVKYVNIEKNTLNRLGDHPGIIRLYYTFQDEQSLYFVLDFAPNGELLSLIKRMGSLDEDCTRYYGAQLLDAVEFMHSKGVIHRDLKPENILLDDKMRIRITDFGTAKLMNALEPSEDGTVRYPEDVRANSFVGTAEYVSPELLQDKAAGKASDIWAFGCIIYQLIAGRPPFKASNEYQTFQKIVKLQFSYPPGFSPVVRDVVKRVLILNPRDRAKIDDIKRTELFESIDWEDKKLIWKRPPPKLLPFKPQTRSMSSSSMAANKLGVSFKPHHQHPHHQFPPQAPQQQQSTQPQLQIRTSVGGANSNPNNVALAASKNAVTSASAAAAALKMQPPQEKPRFGGGVSPTNGKRPALPQTRKSTSQLNGEYMHNSAPRDVNSSPKRAPSHNQLRSNSTSDNQLPLPADSTETSPVDRVPAQPAVAPPPPPPPPPAPPAPPQDKPKIEIPPHTKLDSEWNSILSHYDERVLKVGNIVLLTSTNTNRDDDDSDKEPSKFSKFFTGPRRKKRTLLVTSYARLLIMGNDDKKIRTEIPLSVPQVSVREYQVNRKTNVASFSVETHNKIYTIEDHNGPSSSWIEAINFSKDLYNQHQEEQNSSNFATAAHAAALAAGTTVNMNQPVVDWTNSAFLQRNEERKLKRR